jgi:hypothetical protein
MYMWLLVARRRVVVGGGKKRRWIIFVVVVAGVPVWGWVCRGGGDWGRGGFGKRWEKGGEEEREGSGRRGRTKGDAGGALN